MMAAMQQVTERAREVNQAGLVLLEESTFRQGGAGPVFPLGEHEGRVLLLTLHITRVIDQQSLVLSVWGSADGITWGSEPLLSLPRKSYCGSYETLLDLPVYPDVKYVRAQWNVTRWAKDDRKPLFTVTVSMREPERCD
jgi:hypothetical protein